MALSDPVHSSQGSRAQTTAGNNWHLRVVTQGGSNQGTLAECGEPLYLMASTRGAVTIPRPEGGRVGAVTAAWKRLGRGLPPGRRDCGSRASASVSRTRDPSWGSRLSEPCGQRRRRSPQRVRALQGAGWRRRGPTGADERLQGQQGERRPRFSCLGEGVFSWAVPTPGPSAPADPGLQHGELLLHGEVALGL